MDISLDAIYTSYLAIHSLNDGTKTDYRLKLKSLLCDLVVAFLSFLVDSIVARTSIIIPKNKKVALQAYKCMFDVQNG